MLGESGYFCLSWESVEFCSDKQLIYWWMSWFSDSVLSSIRWAYRDSFPERIWERLKVGEGDNKGWDGWMASPTRWTGVVGERFRSEGIYVYLLEKEMATHFRILDRRIPMDRGAWWVTIHGISKSQTQPRDFHSLTHSWLIHVVRQKPTQHCKAIILQLKS